MSGCLISDGKLFQSRDAAAANVLSPKELCVRPTTSVRSVGRTQSSDTGVGDESAVVSQVARDVAGQRPMNQLGMDWKTLYAHCRSGRWFTSRSSNFDTTDKFEID